MKTIGLVLAIMLCSFIFLGAAPHPTNATDIPTLIAEFIDTKTTQGHPNSYIWTIELLHQDPAAGSLYMELTVWSINPEKNAMTKVRYRVAFQYLSASQRTIIVGSSQESFTEEFCAVEQKGT